MTRRIPPILLLPLYAVAASLLFRRTLTGDRSWFDSGDASLQSWPWLLSVAHAARHLHPVLWEFGSQAGTSLAGELQPGVFYPPTWALGLSGLDGLALCNAYVLLHFAWAATGMHLLLRAERLSGAACLLGASLFAFAGYLPFQANAQPNIFASLSWLPWVLLAYRRALHGDGVRFACLAGLAGGLQIAAGHLQPFIHTSYAVVLCALMCAAADRSPRAVLLTLFGQAMAVCFAAVPIELAHQYLQLSYRWYATGMSRWPHAVPADAYAHGAALAWTDLAGLLRPSTLSEMDGSLYLTTLALPLLPLALLRPTRLALSMAGLLVAALALALGGHAGRLATVFFHLPLLAQLRTPIRAVYLASFAAAVLAAIGLDRLRAWFRSARLVPELLLAGIAVQLIAFDAGVGRPRANPEFAPLYYDHDPALTALIRLSNQGPLVDRFDGQPRDLVPPNAGDVAPVLDVMGQRATMLVSLFDDLSQGWGPAASPTLDRLGVRWIVSDHPIAGLPLVEQGDGWRIYERPKSLSVLWIKAAGGQRSRAPVTAATWSSNQVSFELGPLPAGTRLVFAQPAFSGWIARANGRITGLGQEGIFPAITIAAGTRTISFAYRPSLLAGKLMTLAAGLVLSCAWFGKARALPWTRSRRALRIR